MKAVKPYPFDSRGEQLVVCDECYSEVPQSMTIRLQGEYGNIYLRCSYCEDRRTPTEYPEDENE